MNINDNIKTIENAQAEIDKRLGTARTIAWNLYRKRFHNFFTPGEYGAIFPWLVEPPTINRGTLCAGGERIPSTYLSGDVWRIASSIRREAYSAWKQELIERISEHKEAMRDAERTIRDAERIAQRAASNVERTEKILNRAYRLTK